MSMTESKEVIVPDCEPFSFPRNATVEEIRRTLVGYGVAQVQNATYEIGADGSVEFQRPVGGQKA